MRQDRPNDPSGSSVPSDRRTGRRLGSVLRRGWTVTDLRRHPHHQHRPRLPLYAGNLRGGDDRAALRGRAWLLGRRRSDHGADRALWRGHRDRAAATHLPRAGIVPAARDVCPGAYHQRRGAVDLGPGRPAGPARAGPARGDRRSRPAAADLQRVPDRDRAAGAAHPASRAGQNFGSAGWCAPPPRIAKWSARWA